MIRTNITLYVSQKAKCDSGDSLLDVLEKNNIV